MPDSEPEPPYEGAKPMLPVTILEDRTSLQNMVEEMYPELPERKPKKKKHKMWSNVKSHSVYDDVNWVIFKFKNKIHISEINSHINVDF